MRISRFLWAGALVAAWLVSPSAAHTKPRAAKEMLWVRGTVLSDAKATCAGDVVTLRLWNKEVALCGESRRIAVATAEIAADYEKPLAFDLQGDRATLSPLTTAEPGRRAIVLGEWRPGRRDLFLVALDLCPCESGAVHRQLGSSADSR